jgi:hypothetical protein
VVACCGIRGYHYKNRILFDRLMSECYLLCLLFFVLFGTFINHPRALLQREVISEALNPQCHELCFLVLISYLDSHSYCIRILPSFGI